MVLRPADSWSNWNLEMLILRRGENRVPGEKRLRAKERTNNKLNLHEASMPGFERGPHWWEVWALTTVHSSGMYSSFLSLQIKRPKSMPAFYSSHDCNKQSYKSQITHYISVQRFTFSKDQSFLPPAHSSEPV